jgi:Holliday junction DNA helicase RuvA
MIGKLKGIIDTIADNYILLDVNGVCYLVYLSGHSQQQLGETGTAATLFIETHVREDHIHLYGFATEEEREWFNTLTTVKGVGTKMGLAFLSSLAPSQIALALASQDVAALTVVNGVGKKLAERVVTELKDKVGKLPTGGDMSMPGNSGSTKKIDSGDANIIDAVSALTNLGYSRSDAYIAVTSAHETNSNASVEDLIRVSLKEIST